MHAPSFDPVVRLPVDVCKRDGSVSVFDPEKIRNAILQAGRATGDFDEQEAQLLTAQTIKVLRHRFGGARMLDIEGIQDVVEQVLITGNHFETARAPISFTANSIESCARTRARWWMWPPRSMNIWTGPIGASMPMPTRATLSVG